jgi:hypothetical protein
MKTSRSLSVFYFVFLSFIISSCSVVGGIFKAGMGVGIFICVVIIILAVILIMRFRKKS